MFESSSLLMKDKELKTLMKKMKKHILDADMQENIGKQQQLQNHTKSYLHTKQHKDETSMITICTYRLLPNVVSKYVRTSAYTFLHPA